MNENLLTAIEIVNTLNDNCNYFNYSLCGSVLSSNNINDIDIVACHATHDKMGSCKDIKNMLRGLKISFDFGIENIGLHNTNFKAHTNNIPLHIIVTD